MSADDGLNGRGYFPPSRYSFTFDTTAFENKILTGALDPKPEPPPPPPTRLMYVEDVRVGMVLDLAASRSDDPYASLFGIGGTRSKRRHGVVLDIRNAGGMFSLIVLGDDEEQTALTLHGIQTVKAVLDAPAINGDALLFEVTDESGGAS